MEEKDNEFWQILAMYPSFTIEKVNEDVTLTLKNAHKEDIVFKYRTNEPHEQIVSNLKSKISEHSTDFWGF